VLLIIFVGSLTANNKYDSVRNDAFQKPLCSSVTATGTSRAACTDDSHQSRTPNKDKRGRYWQVLESLTDIFATDSLGVSAFFLCEENYTRLCRNKFQLKIAVECHIVWVRWKADLSIGILMLALALKMAG